MNPLTLPTITPNRHVESRNVRLTEYGARLLGEHALDLPKSDPVRAQIILLLKRYEQAPAIAPTLEAVAA